MGDTPWKKWERTTAEQLSNWLTEGTRKDVLVRQSLMGRMVERLYGDFALNPRGVERWRPLGTWFMQTFHVDAKNRKAFRLPSMLTSPDHPFWEWWAKLSKEASMGGGKKRLMLLLAKPSNERIAVIGQREWKWFEEVLGKPVGKAWFPVFRLYRPEIEEAVRFCELGRLLRWIDPTLLGCPVAAKGACSDGKTKGEEIAVPEKAGDLRTAEAGDGGS